MYSKKTEDEHNSIKLAINMLSDNDLFFETCCNILEHWPNSCDVNLSNKMQNRNAWLGAAACCYAYKCPEYVVRIAWANLTDLERYRANEVAKKIILIYEEKNRKLHSNMGGKMLF